MIADSVTTLDIYLLNIFKTLLLLSPYLLVLAYFYFNLKKDTFFLKIRAETQYNISISLVGISFGLLMLWQVSSILQELSFLNFQLDQSPITHEIKKYKNQEILFIQSSSESSTVLVLLGTLAGILGWLFSTRSQVLNNRRNHSMQLLIESRLSDTYMNSVNVVSTISLDFKKLNPQHNTLAFEFFEHLGIAQKNSVYYMLNYCEFIAVGIRFGDLDEHLMLNTFGSMLKTNYEFFQCVISKKQEVKASHFEHMTELYKRWHKT